ncbi:helix-turn-helix transcriptional regulator [Bacillus sp. ISL-55]|uniref:helix-turn-helix domain-containing protein n=1 Tax=Bacillus sp. ISL-55 TaxID=2819134 RepID=UPI001BEAAB97|nr:helix-turn-helix transcriptional regulator [Bacillus sp. ISL-55]MBT2694634.1 helix-turn-helix domain-containing protein [Bacillus sp. ISL-55]
MIKDAECPTELDKEGLSEDFGKLIKEYRIAKGYSLAQLDKMAKVSPSYVSRIERSLRNEVSFSKVLRICFILGIPYELMISKAFGEIDQVEIEREKQSITEILLHNDFTVKGKTVDVNVKEVLVSIINNLFECPWDSKTKIHDLYQLSKKIEKIKELL